MFKAIILLIVVLGIGAAVGYSYGTKHPTMGDCVNSVIGS